MEEQELRNIVVATGPELLCEGLVARTWGNISARVNAAYDNACKRILSNKNILAWIMKS